MKAAGLRIISAGAARGLLDRVLGDEMALDQSHFGAVGAMQKMFESGADCDLLVLTRAQVDAFAAQGLVSEAADLGWVTTGLGVCESDTQAPVITDQNSLRLALLQASMLYVPDTKQSTAGKHVANMLEQLGLTRHMVARISEHPNGATAMKTMAAQSQAFALGCTQASEIIHTPGVRLIGLLPEPFGLSTLYTLAIPARCGQASAAREAANKLTAADSARQAAGFQ